MNNSEQLTLDFSTSCTESNSTQGSANNVLSLDSLRQAKLDKNLQNVYREIFDSIKHVKLKRRVSSEEDTSYLFG